MDTKIRAPSAPGKQTLAARLHTREVAAMLGVLGAASIITSQTEETLRRSGADVRGNEWDMLVALAAGGPMRPAEMLRRAPMATNAPTVHAIIARLAARGLVEKRPHPDHSRGVLVSLTSDGADLVERMSPILERKIVNGFAGHFSDEELETIADLMARI